MKIRIKPVFIVFAVIALAVILIASSIVSDLKNITITDRGFTASGKSMESDPLAILKEKGYMLDEFDSIDVETNGSDENEIEINILRGIETPINIIAHDSDETASVMCSADDTVADLLSRGGITLKGYDTVTPGLSAPAYGIDEISITREYIVYIKDQDKTIAINALGHTAEEIMERAGVTLSGKDFINYDKNYVLQPEETIEISRVTYKDRTTVEAVPYGTDYQDNNLMVMGTSCLLTPGREGEKAVINRDTYINGEYSCTNFISSEIITEPVNEVIEVGKALSVPFSKRTDNFLTLKDGIPENYLYKLSGDSSAYVASPGAVTASGRLLQIGTVGVDPNVIPYGSELYIVSQDRKFVYGYAVAADTGYITNILVDLFFGWDQDAYCKAVQYGGRLVDIYVLGVGTR